MARVLRLDGAAAQRVRRGRRFAVQVAAHTLAVPRPRRRRHAREGAEGARSSAAARGGRAPRRFQAVRLRPSPAKRLASLPATAPHSAILLYTLPCMFFRARCVYLSGLVPFLVYPFQLHVACMILGRPITHMGVAMLSRGASGSGPHSLCLTDRLTSHISQAHGALGGLFLVHSWVMAEL